MKVWIVWASVMLALIGLQARADTPVRAGITFTEEGLRSFFLAIGDYYRVPEREILLIRERHHLRHDEVPVVYFLSRHAHVSPELILSLRSRGESWMAITLHFHLSPVIYFIEVPGHWGPPYGVALGHYRDRPRHRWHEIRLTDGEIVDLVNLRVASEYHGYLPAQVVRWRSSGREYVQIYDDAARMHRDMDWPIRYRETERERSRR